MRLFRLFLLSVFVLCLNSMEYDKSDLMIDAMLTDRYGVWIFYDVEFLADMESVTCYLIDFHKTLKEKPWLINDFRQLFNDLPEAIIECRLIPSKESICKQIVAAKKEKERRAKKIQKYFSIKVIFENEKKDEGYPFIRYHSKYYGKNCYIVPTLQTKDLKLFKQTNQL